MELNYDMVRIYRKLHSEQIRAEPKNTKQVPILIGVWKILKRKVLLKMAIFNF